MAFPPLSRDELPQWLIELLWKYNADVANSRLKRFVPDTHKFAYVSHHGALYSYLVVIRRVLDDYLKLGLPLDLIAIHLKSLKDVVAWRYDKRLSIKTHESLKTFLHKMPGFWFPFGDEELDFASEQMRVATEHYNSCYELFWFTVDAAHDESIKTMSD